MSSLRLLGLALGPLGALGGALLAFLVPASDELLALPAVLAGLALLLLGLAAFGVGLKAARETSGR